MLDHMDAESFTPNTQLFDGRSSKGVSRGKDDRLISREEMGAEFADRRRLANAVDADDQDHPRPLVGPMQRGLGTAFKQFPGTLFECGLDRRGIADPILADGLTHMLDQLVGYRDANVGAVEGRVQLFK